MGNNLARRISGALKIRDVMEFYGIDFNSRGFARCPFHSEKTASLSIKNNHFKCFGCGQYGGVIDFVMMYFNLSFTQALVKLDSDFALGLMKDKPDYRTRRQIAENEKIKRAYGAWCESLGQERRTVINVRRILYKRYIDGEEWLKDFIGKLDEVLEGEDVRLWRTI